MSKVIELNPRQKRILITHTDLDGVTCAVLYAKCFPGTQVYFVEYDQVNEIVMQLVAEDMDTPIMISDMSVNEDIAELLNVRGNVDLVDHHPTAKWLSVQYPWALCDISFSASHAMYRLLSEKFNIQDYKDLADIADDYDTWGHDTEPKPVSKDLTRLLGLLGQVRFFQRFLQIPSVTLSDTEIALIQLDTEWEQQYINDSLAQVSVAEDAEGNKYGLLAADRYVSVVCHEILKAIPELEYVLSLDFRKDKASVRSRGKVDVGAMAKSLGGGGHKKAAGFPLQQTTPHIFFSCGGKCEYTDRLRNQMRRMKADVEAGLYNPKADDINIPKSTRKQRQQLAKEVLKKED
jgi:oligoribonuclease NrnB/cAMP/cGMP phosphodiesterase (DHH superfamily)